MAHDSVILEPVSLEVQREVELFLYREARILDGGAQREWLDKMVHPEIHYELVIQQERFRRDESGDDRYAVKPFDDDYAALDLRVNKSESGLEWMSDPRPRMRRSITNIEVYLTEQESQWCVYSNGSCVRSRRVYEHATFTYGRKDLICRVEDGSLRLLKRRIEFDERFITDKNIMFFM
jgi:3-phenylpropionate/cinnamic acid dioxygenase small subunit